MADLAKRDLAEFIFLYPAKSIKSCLDLADYIDR